MTPFVLFAALEIGDGRVGGNLVQIVHHWHAPGPGSRVALAQRRAQVHRGSHALAPRIVVRARLGKLVTRRLAVERLRVLAGDEGRL